MLHVFRLRLPNQLHRDGLLLRIVYGDEIRVLLLQGTAADADDVLVLALLLELSDTYNCYIKHFFTSECYDTHIVFNLEQLVQKNNYNTA